MAIHDGHRERMRERIIKNGLENLQPHEVLEFLLYQFIPRKDTNELAHELINNFGSISKVFDAEVDRLTKVKGVGYNLAVYLHSLSGISRIYEMDKIKDTPIIKTAKEAYDYVKPSMATLPKEQIRLLCKNSAGKMVKDALIACGSINSSNIYTRDILEQIVNSQAVAVVLVHNHPSQNYSPSQADIEVTNTIRVMLEVMQVSLDDHIIVTQTGFFSFFRAGLLEKDGQFNVTMENGIVKDIRR